MEKATKQLLNMLFGFGFTISTALTIISGVAIDQKTDDLNKKNENIQLLQQELFAEVTTDESYHRVLNNLIASLESSKANGSISEEEYNKSMAILSSEEFITSLLNKGGESPLSDDLVERQSNINQIKEDYEEQREENDKASTRFGVGITALMSFFGFNIANSIEHSRMKREKGVAIAGANSADNTSNSNNQSRVLSIGKLCDVTDGLLRYDSKSYLRDKYYRKFNN